VRLARIAATSAFGIAVLAWVVLLRPTVLGGSATYVIVSGDSMLPTYRSGDLIVALPAADYGVGSVVVYRIPADEPGAGRLVIHRILADDSATGFTTKGDHNAYIDPWHPTRADVVGTPAHVLPGVGLAIGFLRAPIVAASIASVIAMAWLVSAARRMPPAVEAGQRETAAL